jgi:phytoene dehydrogenase-like protein
VVELTLPSTLDPSLAPPGKHVASIFAQYAPVLAPGDPRWAGLRDAMRDRVLAAVESLAPGFTALIEQLEVLAAPDLERIFGLSGGNIFHGAMTPDRLLFMRPSAALLPYRSPLDGLWLCGSATHPGGGVMGAPGRNAAREILRSLGRG